jgi:hypothetical protein
MNKTLILVGLMTLIGSLTPAFAGEDPAATKPPQTTTDAVIVANYGSGENLNSGTACGTCTNSASSAPLQQSPQSTSLLDPSGTGGTSSTGVGGAN